MRTKLISLLLCFFFCYGIAHASSVEYQVKTISYKNLVGKLYLPASTKKVPVVIAFGGSDGGMNFGEANGAMIAPNGIAVLALAYFKETGLPEKLDHIPLEYFISAIDYLETETAVDPARIGVVSGSRGSEAAFLLATHDARIKSVAVTTPSNVVWNGPTEADAAWTFQGKNFPGLILPDGDRKTQVSRFLTALENQQNLQTVHFALEKVNGPILLVSAENDQVWPSFPMSQDILRYLKERKFKHPVTHKSYPTGHGFSIESAPEIKQSIIDHFLRTL